MEILLLLLIIFVVISVIGSLAIGAVQLIFALLLWMFIGWVAGQIVRGRGYGPLGDILLGLVGGWVGTLVLRVFGIGWGAQGGLVGTIIAGIIGALIVIGLVHLVTDRD